MCCFWWYSEQESEHFPLGFRLFRFVSGHLSNVPTTPQNSADFTSIPVDARLSNHP